MTVREVGAADAGQPGPDRAPARAGRARVGAGRPAAAVQPTPAPSAGSRPPTRPRREVAGDRAVHLQRARSSSAPHRDAAGCRRRAPAESPVPHSSTGQPCLAGDRGQPQVRVHRDRVADRAQHRQVGVAVGVGVASCAGRRRSGRRAGAARRPAPRPTSGAAASRPVQRPSGPTASRAATTSSNSGAQRPGQRLDRAGEQHGAVARRPGVRGPGAAPAALTRGSTCVADVLVDEPVELLRIGPA